MPDNDFNPNSPNAMFSKILERLDGVHVAVDEVRQEQRSVAEELRREHLAGIASIHKRVGEVEKDLGSVKNKFNFLAGKVVGATLAVGALAGFISILIQRIWAK
jgi:tetrahydromethanopterin S-methyltransferase subunit G